MQNRVISSEESAVSMNDDVNTINEKETKMRQMKRLWAPLLLGVLLMATLAGVASARPSARPLEQTWRVLTVPAGDCVPNDSDDSWSAAATSVRCDTGSCMWHCVVHFPAAGEQAVGAVNVKRVTMYAKDNGTSSAGFYLWTTYPPNANGQIMATGTTVNSTADPQVVMDTSIDYNPVYRSQAPVMWLSIGATNIFVYGFYIHYTW
jgi:hypothetical protein